MARRIAIYNQKGGVGKSTTAVNVAVCLTQQKKKVLLVDYDAQGDATKFVNLAAHRNDPQSFTSAHLTLGTRPFNPFRKVLNLDGLDLVIPPSRRDLIPFEAELYKNTALGTRMLRKALEAINQSYDFILVDCSPSSNILAENALSGCSEVLIPIGAEPGNLSGSLDVLEMVQEGEFAGVQNRVLGVLPTFIEGQLKVTKKSLEQAQTIFGDQLFKTLIHKAKDIKESAGKGAPVVLTKPKSRAAKEYKSLAQEVISRGY